MHYIVNVLDIEQVFIELNAESTVRALQDQILIQYCAGSCPSNYKNERTFRQTIQRKIEDHCPQAQGFDATKKEGKFVRIGHGQYRLANGHKLNDFTASEEVPDASEWHEGATKRVFVNSYERNAQARAKCIAHYGPTCVICGFDFAATYGEVGKAFTHIHHLVPLSEVKSMYVVDPIKDLRPVCANCHAIIHRTQPALSLEQVRNTMLSMK